MSEQNESEPESQPELMTATEVGKLWRVNNKTVRRWANDGKLRCVRGPSGRMLFYRSDVMKGLERA